MKKEFVRAVVILLSAMFFIGVASGISLISAGATEQADGNSSYSAEIRE